MLYIKLNNLSFFAFHGLYEEEKINGNDFLMNVVIGFTPSGTVTQICDTIDYSCVYEIIYKRMQIASPLLETIVVELANEILDKFILAETVKIELIKTNPPIHEFNGTVSVMYEQKRN